MDKQKQIDKDINVRSKKIEEMAKVVQRDMCGDRPCEECNYHGKMKILPRYCGVYLIAEKLYNAGYRKIPENAVVLTREELFRDSTQLSKEKQIEIIHNIILENLDYGYEETATAIYDANYRKIPKLGVILPFDHYDNLLKTDKQVRKETAEKFARLVEFHSVATMKDGREYFTISALGLKEILHEEFGIPYDEICKEITDGEKEISNETV